MAGVAFEVVAEFVFEEAIALAATNKLTRGVENLSRKTDEAIFGVTRLASSYAVSFLTGGGGIIGMLGTAIGSSEKFRATQIELANTMLANRFTVNGGIVDFQQALEASDETMGSIIKKARALGISTASLAQGTKIFSAILAPKGLAGPNLSNAINLARVTQKATPALGIDRNQAIGGVTNAIFGTLDKSSGFARVFAEAGDAISKSTGGLVKDVKSFNAAKPDVRLKAMLAGLGKLAGVEDIIAARSELLANRLLVIKDLIVGVGSVLKPLGDALSNIIGPILDEFAVQIKTKGPLVVKLLTSFLDRIGKSPKELFLSVGQFAALEGDIQKAGSALRSLATSILLLNTVTFVSKKFNITKMLLGRGGLTRGMTRAFVKVSRIFQGLMGASIITRILNIIPVFGFLIAIFQIMSRAALKMKLQFLDLLDVFGGRFIVQVQRFTTLIGLILEPFNFVIDIFSDLIVSSTDLTGSFNFVLGIFRKINGAIETFVVIFQGFFIALKSIGAFIGAFIGTIAAGIDDPSKFLSADFLVSIFTNAGEAFNDEMNKGIKGVVDKLLPDQAGEKTVARNVHNNNIKNTFNIKEKIEPDRIAFTITEQLKSLSENRRSAVGRPLIPAGV